VAAEFDGERLEDQEIVGFVALLLITGHITTTALLGNAVVSFDRNPHAAAALEEVLRMLPPFPELGRRTTTEVELGGRAIPANSIVMADLAVAPDDRVEFQNPAVIVSVKRLPLDVEPA
jgi:cytochrome P450